MGSQMAKAWKPGTIPYRPQFMPRPGYPQGSHTNLGHRMNAGQASLVRRSQICREMSHPSWRSCRRVPARNAFRTRTYGRSLATPVGLCDFLRAPGRNLRRNRSQHGLRGIRGNRAPLWCRSTVPATAEMSTDTSPDIAWVELTLRQLGLANRTFDCFSILRPTSPFRKAKRSGELGRSSREQPVSTGSGPSRRHRSTGKMWTVSGNRLHHCFPRRRFGSMHSRQYSALPLIYVQNASLEIAWTRVASTAAPSPGTRLCRFSRKATRA